MIVHPSPPLSAATQTIGAACDAPVNRAREIPEMSPAAALAALEALAAERRSAAVERRYASGRVAARLCGRIVRRASDPTFAPGIPAERFVVRKVVAARSMKDTRGRHVVSWGRLALWLLASEADTRRWHSEGEQMMRQPVPEIEEAV